MIHARYGLHHVCARICKHMLRTAQYSDLVACSMSVVVCARFHAMMSRICMIVIYTSYIRTTVHTQCDLYDLGQEDHDLSDLRFPSKSTPHHDAGLGLGLGLGFHM